MFVVIDPQICAEHYITWAGKLMLPGFTGLYDFVCIYKHLADRLHSSSAVRHNEYILAQFSELKWTVCPWFRAQTWNVGTGQQWLLWGDSEDKLKRGGNCGNIRLIDTRPLRVLRRQETFKRCRTEDNFLYNTTQGIKMVRSMSQSELILQCGTHNTTDLVGGWRKENVPRRRFSPG